MVPRRIFMVALLVRAAFAQPSEAELRSKISQAHYAPLAEVAQVQGDVHLDLNSGVVTVLSGHPLLALMAVENAKSFGSLYGKTHVDVTYHFALVDTAEVPTWVTVKKGNAFERAILRLFGLSTEKRVLRYGCQQREPPVNGLKISGATLEIWIYGRIHCLMTQAVELLAQR